MKKLILISLTILSGSLIKAQLLKPVGNTLPVDVSNLTFNTGTSIFGMISDGSGLSVLHLRTVDTSSTPGGDTILYTSSLQISEWKNSGWDSITTLRVTASSTLFRPVHHSFRKHRDKYYFSFHGAPMGGYYLDTIYGLPKQAYNLVSYSASSGWEAWIPPVSGNPGMAYSRPDGLYGASTLAFNGDTMYLLERISWNQSRLYRHYNSTWDTLALPHTLDSGYMHKLYQDGNDVLYLNSGLYGANKIKGNSLQPISIPRIADVVKTCNYPEYYYNFRYFAKFGSDILTIDDSSGISFWDGSSFQRTKNSRCIWLNSITKFKGKYYALGLPFQSGNNTGASQRIFRLDGLTWIEISSPLTGSDRVHYLVEHQGRLYIAGRFNRQGTENIARLSDNLALVSGYVYKDSNSNCARDTGEATYANAMIRFHPGNKLVNTDEYGRYYLILDSGTHITELMSKKHYAPDCYSINDTFLVASNDIYNADISQSFQPIRDLGAKISSSSGTLARRGAVIYYQIRVSNVGTIYNHGSVTLKFDSRLDSLKSSDSFTKINDSTYTFNVDTLYPNNDQRFNFTLYTPPSNLVIGDRIKLKIHLQTNNDSDTSDNYDSLHQTVIAAYDPNQKDCYPSGKITHDLKVIRYHIQFQNLGTDTAIRVRIVDTFDVRLPLYKAMITNYSHPYTVSVVNNVITWTFNKIMLTPDRVNYEKSQGFISFIAHIDGSLAVGDSIRNKAYIYFDYEDAVITNYASVAKVLDTNIINVPPQKPATGKSIRIYPNPSTGIITVDFPQTGSHTILCFDVLGREVKRLEFNGEGSQTFDLSALPAGIYTLRDESGASTKIIIHR